MITDGIVLLAKQPGLTSFSSLHSIKKSLGTSKVGHTGTLDSFAQGLLVVCTGRLTRLAGNITEFNKTYKAILKFGSETDTLEYTGNIIKTAELPTLESLKKSISKFTGNIMQRPPVYSAIHVDGHRASDLARSGKTAEIPARPVTVFDAELKDVLLNSEKEVEYALIDFSVSKGTYIRSLARDIAESCGSAAHLAGLYRTKVGNFRIEDSAGFSNLQEFTIKNTINTISQQLKILEAKSNSEKKKYIPDEKELKLQEEIRQKIQLFTPETSSLCGFNNITLISTDGELDFKNGKPLLSKNFDTPLHHLKNNSISAVFSTDGAFTGLIEKNSEGRVHYKFVIN